MLDHFNHGLKPLCDAVVCCTSIPSEIRMDLALKASKLGAIYVQDLTSQVTHLITGKLNTIKYKYVAMYRVDVKIMHIDWIFDIYKQWLDGDDIDLLEYEKKYLLPPFYNLLICVTNVPAEQRAIIEEKIVYFGGKYIPDLTKDSTHLIASHASGRKYEYGIKWGIKIVSPEWFWQSIKRGACLEERFFSLDIAPDDMGKDAWYPVKENEKEEDKQVFLKRKIKKIKLDLNQDVWNNIVNETHDTEPDASKEMENRVFVDMTQNTENSELNGMFYGLYFYAWAFDSRKTGILENIIKSHDGIWCITTDDFPESSAHIYIIVSHDLPKSKYLDISRGYFVTEWWIERCLHDKKFINPSEHLLCNPLPCDFPLEGMQDFSICLTGFSVIDLMHISKLILLLGANYYESLNNKRNLLICNTKSTRSKKYMKARDWNIRIVSQDWLWEVVKQGRVIGFDEWEEKTTFKSQTKETYNCDSHGSKILADFTLYFYNIKEMVYMNEILMLAKKMDANISTKLDDSVTHVICDESLSNMDKETDIISTKYKIISSKWLLECHRQLKRLDERDFYNIPSNDKTIKNSTQEHLLNIEKNDIQNSHINYVTGMLKKQDTVFEKKKNKGENKRKINQFINYIDKYSYN